MIDICKHCKNYKTKWLKGKLVAEYCVKNTICLHPTRCCEFSRSLKSRLGLIKYEEIYSSE